MFRYDFNMRKLIYTLALTMFLIPSANAASLMGRLGIGMSEYLPSGMQTLSLKLQRNRSVALGGMFGLDSSNSGANYALGVKMYRLIYEEPQLNFFSAVSGTYYTYQDSTNTTAAGYLVDGTFGSEFSFQGLESIGFSFEFGIGMYTYDNETHIATTGYNMIKSAVHFYL